jgi:phosphoglycerate dehydrogenase-like enzyme
MADGDSHDLTVVLAMRPALTPDFMGPDQWRRLEAIAAVPDHRPLEDFSEPRAADLLGAADVLLTGWGCPRIDAAVLARAPRLKLIAHTGSTVKPVVSDAVWARGVAVSSAAAANALPVAEFALAAILLANKGAFRAREDYRLNGTPSHRPWTMPGEPGNSGAVVGVVGASRTGRALMRLLKNFELRILVYDPVADPADIVALGGRPAALDELCAACDVLSVHAPSLAQTRGLIGATQLALMRAGGTVINTARGDVVDSAALERELASGRINGILDVTDPEPLPPDSALLRLPNVFVTPHVAGAAGHETRRLADLAISEIASLARSDPLRHAVTQSMLATLG